MEKQTGYVVYPQDNVGTAIQPLCPGEVTLLGDPPAAGIWLVEDIPAGHKFALRDIPVGKSIVKYGACIGTATEDIARGSHVHLHNMRSNFDARSSQLDVVTAVPKDVEYNL